MHSPKDPEANSAAEPPPNPAGACDGGVGNGVVGRVGGRRRVHRWGVCRRHQWMEGKEAWRRCRQRWKAVAQRVQGSGAGKGRNRGRGSQLRRAARRAGERAEAAEERLASAHCSVRQLVHRVEAAED